MMVVESWVIEEAGSYISASCHLLWKKKKKYLLKGNLHRERERFFSNFPTWTGVIDVVGLMEQVMVFAKFGAGLGWFGQLWPSSHLPHCLPPTHSSRKLWRNYREIFRDDYLVFLTVGLGGRRGIRRKRKVEGGEEVFEWINQSERGKARERKQIYTMKSEWK